jgi:DNA end-binding protein Ku
MAPRPNWKGYLKLSLVSCPIALYPATARSERVSFRQINKKTGNRLRQQLIDDVTREPVEATDKGKGYEVGKDQYIQVEEDEIESLQVESTHTIEIEKFVPKKQLDERYFDSPYYIIPDDEVGQEAVAVIRDAMARGNVVGIGSVVLSKRERPIVLEPFGKGLRGMTLRYPYEVRNEKDYFSDIPDIKLPKEMLDVAEHIIETKSGNFDPKEFVDHYEVALVDMLKTKQAGQPIKRNASSRPARTNVINIMDLLKRSLSEDKKSKSPSIAPALPKGKAKAKARAS